MLCGSPDYWVQWCMVVIATGYVLFVMSQYDIIFTFPNQRFDEVNWHTMHIVLHALALFIVV